MIIPLISAIVSPFVFGFMNILDKYVIAHKVKKILSFATIAAFVNLLFGLILALFLKWSEIKVETIIYPILAGIFMGLNFYVYYTFIQKEDISHTIGLIYTYPIIVAFLSYFILGEVISPLGYIGVVVTLIGVFMMSIRLNEIKLESKLWMLIFMIFFAAIYEFFVKISTNYMPELNGLAISSTALGLTVMPMLFNGKIRQGIRTELKNVKWAILNETFTFVALLTVYLAMAGLPATIVVSISATQPLAVLLFEKIAHKLFGKITRDESLRPKLVSIATIVIGVILIYASQIS